MRVLAKSAVSNLAAPFSRCCCTSRTRYGQCLNRSEISDFHVQTIRLWVHTASFEGIQECLRNLLLGPFHTLTPVPYLLFGFAPCDSVRLLDLGCELLAFAGYLLEIVIAELGPVFLCRTHQLLPSAFYLFPIHSCLLVELPPTFFRLFAAHEFHEFGLCLNPILVRAVVVSIARLVDLVSARSYLVV